MRGFLFRKFFCGDNYTMREIVYKMDEAKRRAERLKGIKVKLKIHKGRNKYVYREGVISDVYPAVFSFLSDGDTLTFSYSDLLTKQIKIFPSN